MPNSVASMSNFLLLQQSQNKLDNSPLNSPIHSGLFTNNLNTAQLYSSSPSSITCPSLASTTIVVASNANSSTAGLLPVLNQSQTLNHTAGLLNSSNTSMHSAYGTLNAFTSQQQIPPQLSLASTASSSLAITTPLQQSNNQQTTVQPFVHISQLNNQQQQQYSTPNYYYSTLQPSNRRVRVISNNLNGLTTIDDLHMHTDV